MLMLSMIALAVSMDSFVAGTVYGMRNIRMPLASLAVIGACTAFSVAVAVWMGSAASSRISPDIASSIGGLMLAVIGVITVVERIAANRSLNRQELEPLKKRDDAYGPMSATRKFVSKLGAITRLLGNPAQADVDGSRSISVGEACLLGTAVSLDSFAAGLGVRMLGSHSPWIIVLMFSIASSGFIAVGLKIGVHIKASSGVERYTWVPGMVLILIGVYRACS